VRGHIQRARRHRVGATTAPQLGDGAGNGGILLFWPGAAKRPVFGRIGRCGEGFLGPH
jgi:hypothetical protein